jgi:hypothetical protein
MNVTSPKSLIQDKPIKVIPGGTVPLAKADPYFRSVNFLFEWNEDDQGKRTELQQIPKDDVIESLKRKNQAAAAGNEKVPGNSLTFKDVI